MIELVVGQKLYSLNDHTPVRYYQDEKKGAPWYTFTSCKIVKVNPKTVKAKIVERTYNRSKSWTEYFLVNIEDIGFGWHLNKASAISQELKERIRELNNAKQEVVEEQKYVSRLKGMLNTQNKKANK